jgi:hypothetical protein
MTKIAGSGSAFESRSGSISQSHGSADPDLDPHQNVMDPENRERPLVLTGQAFVAGGGRRRGGGAVVGRLVRALNVYLLQDKPAKVFRCFHSTTIHTVLFITVTCIFTRWTVGYRYMIDSAISTDQLY